MQVPALFLCTWIADALYQIKTMDQTHYKIDIKTVLAQASIYGLSVFSNLLEIFMYMNLKTSNVGLFTAMMIANILQIISFGILTLTLKQIA